MFRTSISVFALGLAVSLSNFPAKAEDKPLARYPFDPVCAWGRLADGKGMVIRCLTESESAQLASVRATAPTVPAPPPNSAPVETAASASVLLEADVVSVTADEGTLAIARKKLRSPREQYARCVSSNGGLSADSGEVTVRFLVRERGRAEGASVEKRVGVTEAAARCIAAIVDRRPVGTPEGPVVGATAVIGIKKLLKR
jgi:hypothetical protein